MKWYSLKTDEELDQLIENSNTSSQVIFKHSNRCSISAMVKDRLERKPQPNDITFHFLDLIANRNLSNRIAKEFGVPHESPQILLIRHGRCLYDESHTSIRMDEIEAHLME